MDHIVETGGIKTMEHSLRAVAADGQIGSVGVMRGENHMMDAVPLGTAYASRASFETMNRAIAFH